MRVSSPGDVGYATDEGIADDSGAQLAYAAAQLAYVFLLSAYHPAYSCAYCYCCHATTSGRLLVSEPRITPLHAEPRVECNNASLLVYSLYCTHSHANLHVRCFFGARRRVESVLWIPELVHRVEN